MEKIRNIGFDMTKAFAIYLVLVGHCIQYLSSSDYRDDNLWIFIYSFHMPLFMLVAGYFSASSYKLDFKSLIVKKTKQLIIPMLFWSILIFLAIQFFRQLTHKPILPFVELFVTFATCFWFLKSLFICYVMLFLILKLKYKKTLFLWGGVMMLIFSQFVSIWNVNTMFPCFLAGYIIRTKDNWLQYIKNNWFICFLFFVVLELFYSRYIYQLPEIVSIPTFVEFVSKRIYRIVTGIIASLFWLGLFLSLFAGKMDNKIVNKIASIGQNTLGIYLIQTLILEKICANIICLASFDILIRNILIIPVLSLILLLLCDSLVRMLGKNKIVSRLLLGK